MSCDHLAIGDSHPVWTLPLRSRPEVRKGIVKSRIITGTYILQIDRHKFSQYNIDPNCPLCKTEEENLKSDTFLTQMSVIETNFGSII